MNKQKGNSSILISILVLALLVAVAGGVYFWQNYEKEKAINSVMSKPSSTSKMSDENKVTVLDPSAEEETTEELKGPEVVYVPSGLFTPSETTEVQAKFVSPFVDWNTENSITTVSITIEKPNPEIPGYKYKISYINKGGSNGGFLYGTSVPLEWWMPECMGPDGCNFSAEFKAKYPEIVSKF